MSRWLWNCCLAVTCLVLASCGQSGKSRTVGVSVLTRGNPFFVTIGDNLTAEEFTYVAVERAYLSIVEFHCVAVGPIDRPQARPRVEQSHREAFEWLSVKLGMKNVEIA